MRSTWTLPKFAIDKIDQFKVCLLRKKKRIRIIPFLLPHSLHISHGFMFFRQHSLLLTENAQKAEDEQPPNIHFKTPSYSFVSVGVLFFSYNPK